MSYVGVTLNGINTLDKWGLILLADLVVGTPEVKESRVNVPGRDGSLNLSYALTGGPVYEDRPITFSLFKAASETEFDSVRADFVSCYHGQVVTVKLPTYAEHYFKGSLAAGAPEGFASCRIAVAITVDPYAYKDQITTVAIEADKVPREIILLNEQRKVVPSITARAPAHLEWGGYAVDISAGENIRISNLILTAGENPITITGEGTVTFKYQEARL